MLQEAVKPIRLLLVDDHEVVRMGLGTLFQRSGRIEVVGEAGSAASAVNEAVRLQPDVVLLDLRLPDGSGTEACRNILAACPDARVIFLTSFADEAALVATNLAGAKGYLLKTIGGPALVQAIQSVVEGQSVFDSALTSSALTRQQPPSPQIPEEPCSALSPQERRILPLIAEGKTNKEIGVILGLSDKTVKSYLYNMFQKLQVTRRSQLVSLFCNRRQD